MENSIYYIIGIFIFIVIIVIILIIIKYKWFNDFSNNTKKITKETNEKNITEFINTISDYQFNILKQSYEAYTKLYEYFPFLANTSDTPVGLTYENTKYLFTENITETMKANINKLGSVKGYLGRLFLDLADRGIFYIEAMPYIGMYVLLIFGVRKNMYQTAIDGLVMKYPVEEYDIVINDDVGRTGILNFYFNHMFCENKQYKIAEFDDLVDNKNKNKIPKCSLNQRNSTSSAASQNINECCRSINIESLVNRLRSDAREWSTLTKTNIEGKMEFITNNMSIIGDLLTEYIYIIVLYKNGTPFNTTDTNFNINNIYNEEDQTFFNISFKDFINNINKQSDDMKEFIVNYVDNYNIHISNCVPGLKIGKILNNIKQALIDVKKFNNEGKVRKDFIDALEMFYYLKDIMTNNFDNYMKKINDSTKEINAKCNIGK